jgi:hypothetical protein
MVTKKFSRKLTMHKMVKVAIYLLNKGQVKNKSSKTCYISLERYTFHVFECFFISLLTLMAFDY